MRIECCGVGRLVKETTWLYSAREAFDFEILYEAYCPRCKKPVFYEAGFTYRAGRRSPQRIRGQKEKDTWLSRKNSDLHHVEQPTEKKPKQPKRPDHTRMTLYASDYTLKIKKNVRPNYKRLASALRKIYATRRKQYLCAAQGEPQ